MSYGLIASGEMSIPLKKINCNAEVTDNFGLYTLTQHYCNDSNAEIKVKYLFPIPANSAIISFNALIGNKRFDS